VTQVKDAAAAEWEARIAAVWKRVDSLQPEELVAAVDALAAQRPADDATALFERACARDTSGLEQEAEPLYRAALASDHLDSYRRARATIQLASTLRLLGRLEESERILDAEIDRCEQARVRSPLHDETRAILALTYLAQGRAAESAGLALVTLAPHLSRYNRSVARNAEELAKRSADVIPVPA
jgi:hypothetical protein